MNTSGDAAEQIVRLSLEGVEVAAKITGSAAKNIAAMIYAILKDQNQSKGKAKIETLLKTGKPLDVFTLQKEDCKEFMHQCKDYGILYTPIPYKKKDGTIDVLIPKEDSSRINRIVEKFKLSTVNTASIKSEIEQSKETKNSDKPAPEKDIPDKGADDKLLDDLLGKPQQKEENAPQNPEAAKMAKSRPSEPISESKSKSAEGTSKSERPSVREELKEIRQTRKQEADAPKREDTVSSDKAKQQKTTQHQQPKNRKKSKKSKER